MARTRTRRPPTTHNGLRAHLSKVLMGVADAPGVTRLWYRVLNNR